MNIRRIGIVLNILSSIAIVGLIELAKLYDFNIYYVIALICALIVLILTYFFVVIASGSWKFTHKKEKNMDEREISQNRKIISQAYSIFSVCILSFLLLMVFFELSISMPMLAVFIYLAHIIPAAIAGWKIRHLK